jgi:nicotinamidase-related amidase
MAPRIDRSRLGLFVIDVQPVFLDLAFAGRDQAREALMTRLEHLLMLAAWMGLPAAARRFEKNFFGALSEAAIERAVGALTVRQFAVAGAETDVCVLQTTLGLLDLGYDVFLLEDCLFTTERRPGPALRRMYRAGAIPCTLKTLAYELTGCVDELPWYPEDWALKAHPDAKPFPDRFVAPEEWPDWEPGYG